MVKVRWNSNRSFGTFRLATEGDICRDGSLNDFDVETGAESAARFVARVWFRQRKRLAGSTVIDPPLDASSCSPNGFKSAFVLRSLLRIRVSRFRRAFASDTVALVDSAIDSVSLDSPPPPNSSSLSGTLDLRPADRISSSWRSSDDFAATIFACRWRLLSLKRTCARRFGGVVAKRYVSNES